MGGHWSTWGKLICIIGSGGSNYSVLLLLLREGKRGGGKGRGAIMVICTQWKKIILFQFFFFLFFLSVPLPLLPGLLWPIRVLRAARQQSEIHLAPRQWNPTPLAGSGGEWERPREGESEGDGKTDEWRRKREKKKKERAKQRERKHEMASRLASLGGAKCERGRRREGEDGRIRVRGRRWL